jgi:nucleotide-binding universal stress UspA family protein
MTLSKILILCDFQEASYNALLQSAEMVKKSNGEILLLHLCHNASAYLEAEIKMTALKEQFEKDYSGVFHTLVEQGDILKDIDMIAKREECSMAVMPTHGMKGMQLFTGSLALSVVSETLIPFMVVQQRPMREHGFAKIVIPVEFRSQLVDEIAVFIDIAKLFGSEIYLMTSTRLAQENDATVLESVQEKFAEARVTVQIHASGAFHFSKAVVDYAASIDADLIATINFAYENLYSLFPRTDEEDLIYNQAQIPVLLVTPTKQDDKIEYIPPVI